MVSISPAQITVNTPPSGQVIRIIGVLNGVGTQRRKLGFNRIQPRGVRWQIDRFHVLSRKECFGGTYVGREIIHHDINPALSWIASAEAFETRHNVNTRFPFMHPPDQTVGVNVIEAVQLFDAAFARVGGAMALRMPMACPARARDGT